MNTQSSQRWGAVRVTRKLSVHAKWHHCTKRSSFYTRLLQNPISMQSGQFKIRVLAQAQPEYHGKMSCDWKSETVMKMMYIWQKLNFCKKCILKVHIVYFLWCSLLARVHKHTPTDVHHQRSMMVQLNGSWFRAQMSE